MEKPTRIEASEAGEPLIIASVILAVVAYPESETKSQRAFRAMHAMLNRRARSAGRRTNLAARELFAEFTVQKEGGVLGFANGRGVAGRLNRRLLAADVAAELLFTKASLNSAARSRRSDASHFKHVVWAQSKPVLHLALALRRRLLNWSDPRKPGVFTLLANPDWAPDVLRGAEKWRRILIHASQKLEAFSGIEAVGFVRILPTAGTETIEIRQPPPVAQ
jgi:hypothetical protein